MSVVKEGTYLIMVVTVALSSLSLMSNTFLLLYSTRTSCSSKRQLLKSNPLRTQIVDPLAYLKRHGPLAIF